MRYTCQFEHKNTGERKTVIARLTAEEVYRVRSLTEHADISAEGLALRHAYSEVPDGFLHTEPPAVVTLN